MIYTKKDFLELKFIKAPNDSLIKEKIESLKKRLIKKNHHGELIKNQRNI